MECARYRQAILESVDGSGPIRKAELDRHLNECAECQAFASDMDALRDAAANFEPVPVPDRVWLQIAGRLHQAGRVAAPQGTASMPGRRRNIALLAVAATLTLAVGGSIALLFPEFRANNEGLPRAHTIPGGQPGNAAAGAAVQNTDDVVRSIESEFRLAEEHYQTAIAKLEAATRIDPAAPETAAVDPQTATMLQKNLQVIDQAIAESRAALRAEPQSAPARDSLFDGLKRKVGLLQDTIALMNEMRKGNSAGAAQIVDGLNKS